MSDDFISLQQSNETFTDQEAVCEELTRCCVRLYSDVLDTMLCNERSAKGVDSFKKHLGVSVFQQKHCIHCILT